MSISLCAERNLEKRKKKKVEKECFLFPVLVEIIDEKMKDVEEGIKCIKK